MLNKKQHTHILSNFSQSVLSVPKQIVLQLITFYQKAISPFLGQNCKHYPSCSHYTQEALVKHGFLKGLILSSARIIRCNPWSLGGFDPVPNQVNYLSPRSFKLTGNYQTQLYKQQEN